MKFGGSSVANAEKFRRAARRIAWKRQQGHDVVVVVSAPGDTTDHLLEKAAELTDSPSAREMDVLLATGEQMSIALLSMALHAVDCPAVSLTGPQAGFQTNDHHKAARILNIDTTRIRKELADGKVCIVAGFQGLDPHGDITTLGRGGSDASAIALAAYLGADECLIYTDVDGVYTTDPRLVPEARRLDEISYDEIMELAAAGAKVMQLRSVEFAKQYGVEFEVRSSLAPLPQETGSEQRGTRVVAHLSPQSQRVVSGVAVDSKVARITFWDLPDRPGVASRIFQALGEAKVNVDMVVQSAGVVADRSLTADIAFTCAKDDLDQALEVCQQLLEELPGARLQHDTNVAKVSIVGAGIATHSGVAATMFEALAERNINIELITGSEIKVSCLVSASQAVEAVRAIHEKFALHEPVAGAVDGVGRAGRNSKSVTPLRGNGNKVVSGAGVDPDVARITILSLPDEPGVAARVFTALGKAQVNLDMIVQSAGAVVDGHRTADIAFTCRRDDLDLAQEVCRELLQSFPCAQLVYDVDVAEVFIVGSAIASNYGVAATMFEALARKAINIQLITGSEIKVSCLVEASRAGEGFRSIQEIFEGGRSPAPVGVK